MSNRFIAVQPGTDPNQQLAVINKNFAELDNESVKKLFYDSNGVPSIQIGVQQDGTSRIRVAKAGVDVTTATDAQLAFNSAQNSFKVVQTVIVSLTIVTTGTGNKTATTVVPHGLPYKPAYSAYITIDPALAALSPVNSVDGPSPFIIAGTASPLNMYGLFQVSVDATNITFAGQVSVGGSATLVNSAKVYLLQETAN